MTNNKFSKNALRLSLVAASLVLASANLANATIITQTFSATTGCGVANCGTNGGTVTFTDSGDDITLSANQLKLTFDNTTQNTNVGPGTYLNSSVITGIVFNVLADITTVSSWTFFDGNNTNLAGQWEVLLNISSNIGPSNTVFDVTFRPTNGVNGGIYNAASQGTNLSNVIPDIATLILTISNPNPYTLSSVGSDSTLRMHRVGTNGYGSLKIVTSTSSTSSTSGQTGNGNQIPEPGVLGLLGIGLLGQVLLLRQRRRRLQK